MVPSKNEMVPHDESESNGSDSGANVGKEPVAEAIAQQESRDVASLRLAVLAVLVCSAVAIAVSINRYVVTSEEEQFTDRFQSDSNKIFEAVGDSLDQTFGMLDSVAVALVSHAIFANETWPFVTLPNHAVRMSKILPLSDAFMATFLPKVTPENRDAWEKYSVENDWWVNEATAVQETWDAYSGPIVYSGMKNEKIHDDFDVLPSNVSRLMAPTWQGFPTVANSSYTYNYDWLCSNPDPVLLSLKEHKAVVSNPYMISSGGNPELQMMMDAWAHVYSFFIDPADEPQEPVSELIYPIVNDIDRVEVAGAEGYDPEQHESVGAIVAVIHWRSLIRGILPDDSNGIVVVFTSCSETFTYEIRGSSTIYLGAGDKHDMEYDGHGESRLLTDLKKRSGRKSKYTGAPIDTTYCPITLNVYPSDHMKADFTSKEPTIFPVCALLIFALTSLVFYWYDAKVERRQKTVMSTAVRSTAIVSSLFPATVRDQIYEENNTEFDKTLQPRHGSETGADPIHKGRPIADVYENTTIMFADMVGFTAWSAKRSPVQVFELLETLYQAFDAIALRRKVFKVETIGDCYVAVAGIPNPQEDHAVIMAKFADDCIVKMGQLTTELAAALGEDTASLAMRVGLHSGMVTGGVLRGQKSRFQLFGDTMNTASRMESNGMANRIHVSQETADELTAKGKASWVSSRQEKIVAKGKGELQTYWVSIRFGAAASVAHSVVVHSGIEDTGDSALDTAGLQQTVEV